MSAHWYCPHRSYCDIFGEKCQVPKKPFLGALQKAHRDLSKLTKKVIIDKNGHKMKKEKWYKTQLTQDELKVFIEEARTGKNNNQAFIGIVETDAAQRIEAVCGKKADKIMIESGAIRHSYKKVNHNLNNDDLLHIVDAINTATDIKISIKKHQNNECLEICKDIDGKITFIMEVRIHYGGWLALVTCYRQNRGGATL